MLFWLQVNISFTITILYKKIYLRLKAQLKMHAFPNISKLASVCLLGATLAFTGCASSSTSNSTPDIKPGKPTIASNNQSAQSDEVRNVINRSKSHVRRTGEIYSMRGLLNVFSRGMDVMAKKLRSKGYDAISYNHSNWQPIANDIVRRAKKKQISYPIIIMGHSLGGNEATTMANYLGQRGIKVAYVATYDPTETRSVGKNIGTVVNYYLPNGRNIIKRRKGFKGKLKNINVSNITDIKHTNVEKNRKLQQNSYKKISSLTKKLKKSASKKRRNRKKRS